MKNKITIILFLQSIIYLSPGNHTAIEIMTKVKAIPKPESSVSEIRLEIIREKRGKEKRRVRSFTRYEKQFSSGKYIKKSLVRFQEPESVKGTGLLSWTKTDGTTQQWLFLPRLKTTKRIKSKENGKSFMGTDFVYEDLENREIKDDSLIFGGREMIDGYSCYVIRTIPRIESAYWGKKIYVDDKIWHIRKVEFYQDENTLEKTLYVRDFTLQSNFWSPTFMKIQRVNGNHTIMTIYDFKPNADLENQIFTESFLTKTE